ncbi:17836_t:CDS:10 [Funneliformis geosporum]|uniref:17836_t:CDS:1 n=1 Tax=Funneliformis geosporum TaxID=1117311 RepID=A0A9W4SBN3_9GLOM|nr:17836_t:CDS:10 [Funneliformis geosporum]
MPKYRTKDYQRNLAILLAPTQKELEFETLTEEKDELTEKINSFLKKFKQVQQDAKEQIEQLNQEITQKDDRIAQLHELFQGTAKIFSKQHNFVDHLKTKLQKEQKEKGISEEKSQHLQADIEQLDQQKKELGQRIKELEKEKKNSKAIRDKEIKELKEKVSEFKEQLDIKTEVNKQLRKKVGEQKKSIKELTETEKMAWNKKEIRAFGILREICFILTIKSLKSSEKNEKNQSLFAELVSLGIEGAVPPFSETTADFPHKINRYSTFSIVSTIKVAIENLTRENQSQQQTIKDLTEVKMKREGSEERLKKQSEEFLKVQQMNQVVYDILGKYSTATGLLVRTQEVVKILETIEKALIVNGKPIKRALIEKLSELNRFERELKVHQYELDHPKKEKFHDIHPESEPLAELNKLLDEWYNHNEGKGSEPNPYEIEVHEHQLSYNQVKITAERSIFYNDYYYLIKSGANGILHHSESKLIEREEICSCPQYNIATNFYDFGSAYELNLKLYKLNNSLVEIDGLITAGIGQDTKGNQSPVGNEINSLLEELESVNPSGTCLTFFGYQNTILTRVTESISAKIGGNSFVNKFFECVVDTTLNDDKGQNNRQTERSVVSESSTNGIQGSNFLQPHLYSIDHTKAEYTFYQFWHRYILSGKYPLSLRIEFNQNLLNQYKKKRKLKGKMTYDYYNSLNFGGEILNFPGFLKKNNHRDFYQKKLPSSVNIESRGGNATGDFNLLRIIKNLKESIGRDKQTGVDGMKSNGEDLFPKLIEKGSAKMKIDSPAHSGSSCPHQVCLPRSLSNHPGREGDKREFRARDNNCQIILMQDGEFEEIRPIGESEGNPPSDSAKTHSFTPLEIPTKLFDPNSLPTNSNLTPSPTGSGEIEVNVPDIDNGPDPDFGTDPDGDPEKPTDPDPTKDPEKPTDPDTGPAPD